MSIYNGLDNQLQNLQNQLSQITQLYNGGQAPQTVPVMHTQRQVMQVQGWRGIEDLRLNPGESVLAQDADTNIIFFKNCDANGISKIRALEWNDVTERYTNPPPVTDNFVTKDEFNNFKSELSALISEYMKGEKTE